MYKKTLEEHKKMVQSMEELDQLKNLWPDSVVEFNEMIQEKMIEYGISSEKP